MKKEKRVLLFLIIVGMELSWCYAWANFLTISVLHKPFPFPEAICTFVLAAGLTIFSKGKGWRIISILGIQVLGFILASLRIVYAFNTSLYSFFSQTWLIEFFDTLRSPQEWLKLILVLFLSLMLWVGGITLAKRPKAYATLSYRFDLGIAAFFLLFLTKIFLLAKGGIKIDDPISLSFFFPFFVFSLLAIGLVRNRRTTPKDFLPGYQGIGVILSFIAVVVLFGTGLVLFFLPYLTRAAETGYGILKTAAKPLVPFLATALRFIFLHSTNFRHGTENWYSSSDGSTGNLVSPHESNWWTEFIDKILTWGGGGVFGLILLIVAGLVFFFLFRWLLSKTQVSQRKQSTWYSILLWAERLRMFLLSCWRGVIRRVKGYKAAVQLYTALLGWGRHSGLPHFLNETPNEYSFRLKSRFPSLSREIESIVQAFNQEVYGEITLNQQQFAIAKSAWHRLRNPLHWPSRLKTWFLRPANLSEDTQYRTLDSRS
jgi:hypothetical protein